MNRKLIVILNVAFFAFQFFSVGSYAMAKEESLKEKMTQEGYAGTLRMQDQIHNFIRSASSSEKKGDYQSALEYYLKAYEINKCAGLVAVCRGGLADNYEALGKYNNALEHVQWFLSELKPTNNPTLDRTYFQMKAAEVRLLQKIEAQQREYKMQKVAALPATSLSRSTNIVSDFQKADYASQKKFLEKNLPEETEILRLAKQAMLAEHTGDFAKAGNFYGQLLAQKDAVVAAQGETAWAMLHCAVQRMSELTGDEAREKEMLNWIKANMLDPQGQFHQSLAHLMPGVVDHLKKQVKKYQLS